MAAAMKRPAAASAQQAAKRPAVAKQAGASVRQCDAVAAALAASPDFPAEVLEMLGTSLKASIGVPREGRHPFQDEVARMIGDVISKREEGLQAGATAAEGKLEEVNAQKAEREGVQGAAVQELSAKEEATAAAQTAAGEAVTGLMAAKEALTAAEAALAAGQEALTAAEAKKAQLSSMLNDDYVPIKEGTAEPAKVQQGIAAMVRIGKDFSLDKTLLESAPVAAAKAPSDRGSFDGIVLQQLEAEFQKCTASLEDTIATAEPTKKELEAKVAEASAGVERALAAEQESKAAAEAAKAAQKEALAARRAAAKAVQQCGPELKQAAAALEAAKAELAKFREGPLAAYKALLERT
eukprot:CAMPEP_0204556464 /NCGR_PEP_ID=MMETSP0661-20131031/29608_1 /ASSEMBLY_ACC=CAM_ASM_000606 /TAXON_ID=109239 /ORGANISM="Alexandrium margalefi, Strain AMGDE01CS-322" /LENGTH=352 /DNA_ID=CAMNT_0051563573 /DNA_START=48 /DNA_END=1102 /DNA_ORIENTATION=+